jgi:hypothetical protein
MRFLKRSNRDFYLTEEDFQKAEENGIPEKLVIARYAHKGYNHWTKEEILSSPKREGNYRYSDEILSKAEANGVKYKLFVERVFKGWSEEKAATTPPRKKKKRTFSLYK